MASYKMTADEQLPQEARNMMIDFEFVGEWESENMRKAGLKRHLINEHCRLHIDQVRGKGFNRGNAGSEDRWADRPDP
jgi:hypothetical protein